MSGYLLGVVTVPALVTGCVLAYVALRLVTGWLGSRGIFVEVKNRTTENISQYVLRNNIWWERSWGPVFTGGWYREKPRYCQPDLMIATRWIGLGSPDGRCAMVFHRRDLGEATPPTTQPRTPAGSTEEATS